MTLIKLNNIKIVPPFSNWSYRQTITNFLNWLYFEKEEHGKNNEHRNNKLIKLYDEFYEFYKNGSIDPLKGGDKV
jgi:hypothetical protein